MKLVITIPLDLNDFEEADFHRMVAEAIPDGACLHVEIERSISEEESEVCRVFSISADYFGVEIRE